MRNNSKHDNITLKLFGETEDMFVENVLKVLKGTCGISSTYRAILICAVCICAFAFIVMFEYTFEYSRTNLTLNMSANSNLVTTKQVNTIRFVAHTEKKAAATSLVVPTKVIPPSKSEAKVPQQTAEIKQNNLKLKAKTIEATNAKVKYAVTLEKGYVLENPSLCSSVDKLSVLIIIHTAPGNFLRRMNIRTTYANATFFKPVGNLRVLFLLGRVKVPSVQDKILAEFHQYGDILQGDFIDAYRNLTHKGVMGYKWIQERCRNANVILKADDDVIVNTYKLFTEILPEFEKKSKSILCNHILPGTMLIIRDKKSKWYVNENEFKGQKFYPRYCSGFFVMITNDVIPAIYQSAFKTPFFWVDDVYLYGLLPGKAEGITYSNLKKGSFNLAPINTLKCYRNASRVCNYLVTGASKPAHVAEIWKHMSEQELRKIEAKIATTTQTSEYEHDASKVADKDRHSQRRRSPAKLMKNQPYDSGNNRRPAYSHDKT